MPTLEERQRIKARRDREYQGQRAIADRAKPKDAFPNVTEAVKGVVEEFVPEPRRKLGGGLVEDVNAGDRLTTLRARAAQERKSARLGDLEKKKQGGKIVRTGEITTDPLRADLAQRKTGGNGGNEVAANPSGGKIVRTGEITTDPLRAEGRGAEKQIGDGGQLQILKKNVSGDTVTYTEPGTGRTGTITIPSGQRRFNPEFGELSDGYTGQDIRGNVFGNRERLGGTVSVLDFSGFRGKNYNPDDYAEIPSFAAVNRRYAEEVAGAGQQQAEIDRSIVQRAAARKAEKANRPLERLLSDLRGSTTRAGIDAQQKLGEQIAKNRAEAASQANSGGGEISTADLVAAQRLGLDERKTRSNQEKDNIRLGLDLARNQREENQYRYGLEKGEREFKLNIANLGERQRALDIEIFKAFNNILTDPNFSGLSNKAQREILREALRSRGIPEENLDTEIARYLG